LVGDLGVSAQCRGFHCRKAASDPLAARSLLVICACRLSEVSAIKPVRLSIACLRAQTSIQWNVI
jgi:hypothetical protein